MKLPKRFNLGIAIALFAGLVLILLFVPSSSNVTDGSSYSRFPEGYGAWYEYMQKKGANIQRWRKPIDNLLENNTTGNTLIQVYGELVPNHSINIANDWVNKGNTLIILGRQAPPTSASFSNRLETPWGIIKINTSRRYEIKNENPENIILRDSFGAIIWQGAMGEGKIIFCATPYLAANAYLDFQGNYEILAQLAQGQLTGVQQVSTHNSAVFTQNNANSPTIWFDEYIHGYKDKETIEEELENRPTLINYFKKTPIYPIVIQTVIIILITIFALNRRFGKAKIVQPPTVNNSQVYIEALAGVLRKAATHNFVVETIGKAEQKKLQHKLGLGQDLVEEKTLFTSWKQQTGLSFTPLSQVLKVYKHSHKVSEKQLVRWLKKWREINQKLD